MNLRMSRYLVAGLVLTLASACSTTSDGGPGPASPSGLATYGACGLEPNYLPTTFFEGRFIMFPINVFIDLSGAAADLQGEYQTALEQGFKSWETASGGEIGAVTFVNGPGFAHVTATFIPLIPGASFALGASRVIDFQPGTPNLTTQTAIEFSSNNLATRFDEDFRNGVITVEEFTQAIAGLAAHELGHSFGMTTHASVGNEWLMSTEGASAHSSPTVTDLNTLKDNYCRP